MNKKTKELTDSYLWEINEKTGGYRLVPYTEPWDPGYRYYKFYELPPSIKATIKVRPEDMLF